MTSDKRPRLHTRPHYGYTQIVSSLLLGGVLGLSTACVSQQPPQRQSLEPKTVVNDTSAKIARQTPKPVSTSKSVPVAISHRQPTEEQLLESIRKLSSEENPDTEVMVMLLERLQALYGAKYDFNEVDDEKTRVFSAMQANALSDDATGRDLYYYSLIIREPRVRDLLNLSLTQAQADKLADELQAKAVAQGDLSALTKTGYDNIVQAIGEPIFSTEKIDRSYQPYYEVDVKDYAILATGLTQLATALKSQCLVDYHPTLDYPFYYHHVYGESGDITMNRNRPIGNRLYEFSRSEVAEHPDIEDLLDMIYLRNNVYCYQRDYVLNELSSFLTGQTDGTAARSYSIPDVKDRDPMRHRVVLSIIAELIDKEELLPVFSYPLDAEDQKQFNVQREQLLNKYRRFYADSIPVDTKLDWY